MVSMIKAYGQAGNVEQVCVLWHELDEHGVTPTAITFGCALEGFAMSKQTHRIFAVHAEMCVGDLPRNTQ